MRYQAYFASVFVTSSVVGPVLGGFFAEHLHWSFIFWINLPLGAGALAMTNGVLKRLPRHERPHKLDVIGALLMVAATVALLLALSWGGSDLSLDLAADDRPARRHRSSPGCCSRSRLLTAAEPFVPLAVLFNPVVGTGTAANFFVVGTMVGLSIFVPIYFEAVVGLTASQSGLALIALMGGTVTGAQIAGRIMAWTRALQARADRRPRGRRRRHGDPRLARGARCRCGRSRCCSPSPASASARSSR